jgi:hypothetical protein
MSVENASIDAVFGCLGRVGLKGAFNMPSSRVPLSQVVLFAITMIVVIGAGSGASAPQSFAAEGASSTGPASRLVFNDPLLTNCYYRNQFFDKNIRAIFGLFGANGTTQIDPPSGPLYEISRFAVYAKTPSDAGISGGHSGHGIVRSTCDGFEYDIPTTNSQLPTINLLMKNQPPLSKGITATQNGVAVKGVPLGSEVTLSANASSANPLTLV